MIFITKRKIYYNIFLFVIIMIQLDQKDRRILYELDCNSRASLSYIGKKVKLSKPSVQYRINKLIENGIIKNFHTMINTGLLGLKPVRIQFIYQYQTPEIEKKIINYLMNNNYASLIASAQGLFDLSVILQIRHLKEFIKTWIEIQNDYGMYFEKQIITFPIKDIHFKPSFILLDQFKKEDREEPIIIDYYKNSNFKIDNNDIEILKQISANARMALTEIARKTNLSDKVVKYRLNKLIKNGIIVNFRLDMDLSKIGYQLVRAYVYLQSYKYRFKIIDYIKQNPNLTWIDATVGESHLEFEFQLNNIRELYEIMQDIRRKFPDVIKNYKYIILLKSYKYLYFPNL